MTTQASFTKDEWQLIVDAPFKAGLGVSLSDFGIVSFAKEFAALMRFVTQAKERYAGNELVQALAVALEEQRADGDAPEPGDAKPPSDLFAGIAEARAAVDAKASSEEARGFRTFLVELADAVANASGEGLLGFGEKVSAEEREYLDKLRAVLS